jgi:uncharacterized protein YndB with AHSA1/START domain
MSKWFCRGIAANTVKVHEVDLRAGGRLRLEVNGADGKTWKLLGEYREVCKPARLSFTWSFENDPTHGETLVTVDFRRLGESNFTEVRLRHEGFLTEQSCKGHNEGWIACYALLDEISETLLRSLAQQPDDFSLELERVLDAPNARAWDFFTKPELMERWFTNAHHNQVVKISEQDLRVGGHLRLTNTLVSGEVYRLDCEYREVSPPRRLVFAFVWLSHPHHGDSVVTIELAPLGAERTRVRFRQEKFPSAKARDDHRGGWIECFEVLRQSLAA